MTINLVSLVMRPHKTPTSSVTTPDTTSPDTSTPDLLAETTLDQTMSERQARHVPIMVEGGRVIENMGEETNVFRIEFEETFTQDFRKHMVRTSTPVRKQSSKGYCYNGFESMSEAKDCNKVL